MQSKIPNEISKLKPINTRAKKQGDHYLVIKRTSKRINGKNIPVELGTIGHIRKENGNWVYIPKVTKLIDIEISTLEYGFTYLINKENSNLLDELLCDFPYDISIIIYLLAIIRVSYSNIARDTKLNYDNDFISILYPKIRLDDKYISSMLEELGRRPHLINKFMINRIKRGSGIYIIDGMLKTNDSSTNSLSEYSRKGSKKGRRDISLIYSYDIVSKEPIASATYPGNMLDQSALLDFIDKYQLNGTIIMDKGFYSKFNMDILHTNNLKYIIPIKRCDKRISEYMLDEKYDGILDIKESKVFYKKTKIADKFFYSFLDIDISKSEAKGYLDKHRNDSNLLDKYKIKESRFGLIVFESNVNLSPKDIYDTYDDRWEIELVFKYYQSLLDLDTMRVQGDLRLAATEFVNFIATIMTLRLKKLYKKLDLNRCYSYDQLKNMLFKLKVSSVTPNITSSWKSNKTLKYLNELFVKLGVI